MQSSLSFSLSSAYDPQKHSAGLPTHEPARPLSCETTHSARSRASKPAGDGSGGSGPGARRLGDAAGRADGSICMLTSSAAGAESRGQFWSAAALAVRLRRAVNWAVSAPAAAISARGQSGRTRRPGGGEEAEGVNRGAVVRRRVTGTARVYGEIATKSITYRGRM